MSFTIGETGIARIKVLLTIDHGITGGFTAIQKEVIAAGRDEGILEGLTTDNVRCREKALEITITPKPGEDTDAFKWRVAEMEKAIIAIAERVGNIVTLIVKAADASTVTRRLGGHHQLANIREFPIDDRCVLIRATADVGYLQFGTSECTAALMRIRGDASDIAKGIAKGARAARSEHGKK